MKSSSPQRCRLSGYWSIGLIPRHSMRLKTGLDAAPAGRLENRHARASPRSACADPCGVGCALVLALAACSRSSERGAQPPSGRPRYMSMQMNLCLSGLASCDGKLDCPAGAEEAVARIREERPDAVTVNEVCRSDVALIARRSGYRLRFSRVIYHGRPLRCVHPSGRGLFGEAVLTKAAIDDAETQASRYRPVPSGACGCASARWLPSTSAPPTSPPRDRRGSRERPAVR